MSDLTAAERFAIQVANGVTLDNVATVAAKHDALVALVITVVHHGDEPCVRMVAGPCYQEHAGVVRLLEQTLALLRKGKVTDVKNK